jgi:chorismate mutase
VTENQVELILQATRELLEEILCANPTLDRADLAAAWFTLTSDLDAVFPAQAARQLGWKHVPLMCAREIPVPGSLPRCIRLMLFWNTELSQNEIQHIYLRRAAALRPDLEEE